MQDHLREGAFVEQNTRLHEENKRLKERNEALHKINESLKQEVSRLRTKNKALEDWASQRPVKTLNLSFETSFVFQENIFEGSKF